MLHAVTGSRPGGGMCASIHAVIHVTTECATLSPAFSSLSLTNCAHVHAWAQPSRVGSQCPAVGEGGGMSAYIAVGALVGCAELCRPVGMG